MNSPYNEYISRIQPFRYRESRLYRIEIFFYKVIFGVFSQPLPNTLIFDFFNRFLRTQDCFKTFTQKKWIVWSDCGGHFRCAELMNYCFNVLAKEKIRICLNFLAGIFKSSFHIFNINFHLKIIDAWEAFFVTLHRRAVLFECLELGIYQL